MSLFKKRLPETFQVDEELLCLICTELVEQAKQVDCCGGLFCGACIDQWLGRVGNTHDQVCPQCRAVLKKTSVVPDVRSDRKSAAQPRRCPLHANRGCDYIGTRQEIAAHKVECPYDPDFCNRCKDEKAILEALHANEKFKWVAAEVQMKATQAQQEQTIRTLTKAIDDNDKAARRAAKDAAASTKQALRAAAWQTPEVILKRACGFDGVQIFTKVPISAYTVTTGKYPHPSFQDIELVCSEMSDNVSLFCYRSPRAVAPAGGFPRLKVIATLLSPDPAVVEADFTTEIILQSDLPVQNGFGNFTWMAPVLFKKYAKDGKFALGWTVTIVP